MEMERKTTRKSGSTLSRGTYALELPKNTINKIKHYEYIGKDFDNYENSLLVFSQKTGQMGILYPKTFMGQIIFLEDVPPDSKKPITHYNVIFDDDPRFRLFEIWGEL